VLTPGAYRVALDMRAQDGGAMSCRHQDHLQIH
jgi:hypothetical protein